MIVDRQQYLLVKRQDAGTLWDKVAVVEVIGLHFVGDAGRHVRSPAHGLLDAGAKSRQIRGVGELRHASAALLVDLLLDLSLPLGVIQHGKEEVVERSSNGEDTD